MDLDGIRGICDALGLRYGPPYDGKKGVNISISCPMAPWTHRDPTDENKGCSILVDPDGPSSACCHSSMCDYSGSWYRLIMKVAKKRGTPEEPIPPLFTKLLDRISKAEDVSLEAAFQRAALRYEKAQAAVSSLYFDSETGRIVTESDVKRLPNTWDYDVLDESVLGEFTTDLPPYVAGRGITDATAERWELLYDEQLGRVVFPARRFDGKLIGRVGRITPERAAQVEARGSDPIKYYNYSGLNKTRYLFGAHLLRAGRPVVIVEGPFDALKTDQALLGEASVTATLGKGFSKDHAATVRWSMPPAAYIFTDDDPAGLLAAKKIASVFGGWCPLYFMRPIGASDPGAMTEENIRKAFREARPFLET